MMGDSKMYQSSIIPGQRIVYGPFGELGYIVNPNRRISPPEDFVVQRNIKLNKAASAKALKIEAFQRTQLDKLEMIKIRSAAQRWVDLGMKQADYEFEQKRNRLRKSLLEEESKYIAEYTTKAQTSLEKKLEAIMKKVEEIEKKNQVSDNLQAQIAYDKLAIQQDVGFREEIRLKNCKNVAEAIKHQLREKEQANIQQECEDQMWNEMYDKRVRLERQKFEEYEVEKIQKKQQWIEALGKQVEAQKRVKMNMKCLEDLDDIRMKEYLDEKEAEYAARDREWNDRLIAQVRTWEQQIADNKRYAERKQNEESAMDRILVEDVKRKINRAEAEEVSNSNQARVELGLFKEANTQYRNAVAEENLVVQKMIDEDMKRMTIEEILGRKKAATAKKDLARLCKERSKQMADEKRAREAQIEERDVKYNMLLEYKTGISRNLDKAKLLSRPVFRDPKIMAVQNQNNEKYLEVLRKREKFEDLEMLDKMRTSRDETLNKIRQTLAQPLPEITGTSLHPFYRLISSKTS